MSKKVKKQLVQYDGSKTIESVREFLTECKERETPILLLEQGRKPNLNTNVMYITDIYDFFAKGYVYKRDKVNPNNKKIVETINYVDVLTGEYSVFLPRDCEITI